MLPVFLLSVYAPCIAPAHTNPVSQLPLCIITHKKCIFLGSQQGQPNLFMSQVVWRRALPCCTSSNAFQLSQDRGPPRWKHPLPTFHLYKDCLDKLGYFRAFSWQQDTRTLLRLSEISLCAVLRLRLSNRTLFNYLATGSLNTPSGGFITVPVCPLIGFLYLNSSGLLYTR